MKSTISSSLIRFEPFAIAKAANSKAKGRFFRLALLSGLLLTQQASANVSVQGWWRFGELPDYYGDSSGHNRRFGSAFSCAGSGNAGAGVESFGCGGPLGSTGSNSTSCLYWTPKNCGSAGMWGPGAPGDPDYGTGTPLYNPPATNYVIECWVLPDPDVSGYGKFFMSGSTDFTQPNRSAGAGPGGVYFQRTNDGTTFQIGAFVVANASQGVATDTQIGNYVLADTNRWMHLAVVNDRGTNTFYVNGVANGAPQPFNTVPNGNIFAGCGEGTYGAFHGYLDELRISTFASGAFSTTDLLTRALSPDILTQPQPANVWSGGAAPFSVSVALDNSTTYQWQRGGANLSGANSGEYYLNVVGPGDNLAQFDCVLNNYTGIAKTSSVATLTVVAPNPSNIAAYENAVTAEHSLVAYYTMDGDTGTTLTDIKGGNTATLEGTAEFDGRTDRAFGVRALRLKNTGDGDATLPNNGGLYEFASGSGTIEAIVHLEQALGTASETIFAESGDGGIPLYYAIQASPDGTTLIYSDDNTNLSWAVTPPLLGRQAHVAVVFTNNTITAYVDGLPLSTKPHASFGNNPGLQCYIGSVSLDAPGVFCGTIDELALYTNALSANTIAIHNSKFLYGTNTSAPTITGLPGTGTRTLLAGGQASFSVTAAGTAPLSFQWTRNGSAIAGATSATITISPTTIAGSGAYGVTVSNPYGSTNSPTFTLNFVAPPDRYSSIVMGDNPMAYWRLDETNGTTAFDSAGAHDGTYSGSYTLGAAPLPTLNDAAVHFTGGHAEVPFSAALNPGTAFSVEFWAMPDVQTIYVPVCSQYRNGNARLGWCFYMENDADSWETHLGNSGGVALYCYGGGPVPLPGQYYHVIEVYDGAGNSYLYAENQLVGHNTQVANGGTYVPNPSAPLEIGVRNQGSFPFNGFIDEVAIYNYALTPEQISNHWSIKFQASAITSNPVGVTNIEGSTVTLSATASGFPNTYQWYQGASPLTDTLNADGSAHYSSGVTGATLVITEALPSDSGQYKLVVSNPIPGGGSQTVPVAVLITNDVSLPKISSVVTLATPNAPPNSAGPSPYLVKVLFNKRLNAGAFGAYTIAGTTVSSTKLLQDETAAPLGADWREVILQTTGLTPGAFYTLNASGAMDQTVTGNTMATTNITFRAPLLLPGTAAWDYYYLDASSPGNPISDLYVNGNYPNAPMTNGYSTSMDTTPITTGDLNNVAPFGVLGDNYGDSLSAWITPTVSGDYTFFLDGDDSSELYLSTDSNPQNAAMIAYNETCCHGFVEPTNNSPTGTSVPITLVANTPYFIRATHHEGGGGDYVKVAWRIAGDPTPAPSLRPIPGTYLSSYFPGPLAFNPIVISGGHVTISWTGTATLLQSSDLKTWTAVSFVSPYQVAVGASPRMFYRLVQ